MAFCHFTQTAFRDSECNPTLLSYHSLCPKFYLIKLQVLYASLVLLRCLYQHVTDIYSGIERFERFDMHVCWCQEGFGKEKNEVKSVDYFRSFRHDVIIRGRI
jgi:hypothetical protein